MESVTFVVTTPSFNGPLDLLMQMIANHDLDVWDVPLAPIVDSFVAVMLEATTKLEMNELSEFLLIAAVLVDMKSQRLLPGPDERDLDEEFIGWEERDVLLARLLELRTYASLADSFVSLFERAGLALPRAVGVDDGVVVAPPDLLAGVTSLDVAAAYGRALAERSVPAVRLHHVTVDAVTVAETVAELSRRLPFVGRLSFRELTADLLTRIEVIVHFLALLELCKLGHVELGQGGTFADVQIRWISSLDDLTFEKVDAYEG